MLFIAWVCFRNDGIILSFTVEASPYDLDDNKATFDLILEVQPLHVIMLKMWGARKSQSVASLASAAIYLCRAGSNPPGDARRISII